MSVSPSANIYCVRCGFESPTGFSFCGRCGSPLADQNSTFAPAQVEKQPDKSADHAERRQLTVMFCDLVGSTALSEQLDPEDLREVMLAYRDVCSKVINRFEGYIAQFLGDGLLVYFGYPVAHEDDAHRAVRTGLGIVEAIKNLNPVLEKRKGVKLAVRLGIHTGLVVAGDMATGYQLQPKAVVGETPNVAARVHSLAEIDSIVISQATYRLVQGYFECRSKGAHTLKGISRHVEIFEVISESAARTRLDVAVATGFTPLTGREKEWQDAAYQQQLRSKRQISHQCIAQVLEKEFRDTVEAQPELVAYHYTEANLVEQAIPYWLKAGRRAMERSANVEAISNLTKGIELLKRLNEIPERLEQELEFLTTLGPAYQAIRGFGAAEVRQTYNRAQEIIQTVGDSPQLFPALWGVWYFHAIRPEEKKAVELGVQLVTLAQNLQDPTLLLVAYRSLGASLFVYGEPAQAWECLKQGIALYDPQKHSSLAHVYGQELGVICRCWASWSLFLLGFPNQAQEMALEAIRMGRDLSHPHTLAYTLSSQAMFYLLLRDTKQGVELAQETFKLASEQGFMFWYAHSSMMLGSFADSSQVEDGMIQTRGFMAGLQAAGAELLLPMYQIWMAEIFASLGKFEDGLAAAAEGLALAESGEERSWEADLHRVKGDLLLLQGADESEAESCYQQAINIAQNQATKLYELRATVGLSRLWQKQGKIAEACEMLSGIYNWFTEGFETVDLKEAKTLLESLS